MLPYFEWTKGGNDMRSFANCFLGLLEDLYRIKSCFRSPEVVKMIHCYDQILKNGHFWRSLAIFSSFCYCIWLKMYRKLVQIDVYTFCIDTMAWNTHLHPSNWGPNPENCLFRGHLAIFVGFSPLSRVFLIVFSWKCTES